MAVTDQVALDFIVKPYQRNEKGRCPQHYPILEVVVSEIFIGAVELGPSSNIIVHLTSEQELASQEWDVFLFSHIPPVEASFVD